MSALRVLPRNCLRNPWTAVGCVSSATARRLPPRIVPKIVPRGNPHRGYSTTPSDAVEIVICDPRVLFPPHGDPTDPAVEDSVIGPIKVPRDVVLGPPAEELDSYQPMNSFYFGERSEELFEYAFLGNHNTATDYTCIAVKDHLAELRESGLDWDAFREAWKSERDTAGGQYRFSRFAKSLPFLGNLESSYGLEGASVHVLRRGGEVRGLLITSIPGDAD